MNLCGRIDEARERWNVLRHPFYTRWERGELTRDELAFYAGEYRHAVVALAEAASAVGDPEHAREEAEHLALWDAFAGALDAPLDREPTSETSACAQAWSRPDRLEALAVLYAVESSQPAIAETKLHGLVEHYGFRPDTDGTEYFTVHAERDKEHARAARTALGDAEPADIPRLVTVAEEALRANWLLLDSVERAA
jgi:pyrroloquinoline-quinone synthase